MDSLGRDTSNRRSLPTRSLLMGRTPTKEQQCLSSCQVRAMGVNDFKRVTTTISALKAIALSTTTTTQRFLYLPYSLQWERLLSLWAVLLLFSCSDFAAFV